MIRQGPKQRTIEGLREFEESTPMSTAPDTNIEEDAELEEIKASFPWLKSFTEGLKDEISELKREIDNLKTAAEIAKQEDVTDAVMPSSFDPGDENFDGGDVDMEFDVSVNDTSITVKQGHVVLEGGDTYWFLSEQAKAVTGASEYAYPSITYTIGSLTEPTLEILAAYPKPTSSKISRPLCRLKSDDGGVTWAVDDTIPIYNRGSIHLTEPILHGK